MNPRLVVINGSNKGSIFPLSEDEVTIGRGSASSVPLNHSSVSRRHCVIRRQGDQFKICDLDSYNGTFVNNVAVKEETITHADQLRVGSIALIFLTGETEAISSGQMVQLDDDLTLLSESSKELKPELLLHETEQAFVDSPELLRLSRQLAALLRIATRINTLRQTQELVREILDSVFEVVPADRGAILLTQGEKEFSSIHGKHRHEHTGTVHVSRTVVERVISEGVAIFTNDINTSETLAKAESLVAAQISSLMCAPLTVFEKIVGVIYLDTSDPIARFDEEHLRLLAGIAGIAAVSLENSRRMEWLEGENSRLRSSLAIEHNMIGESPAMEEVYRFIQRVAPARSAVLICGESGTGKELAAHAIHANSLRANQPFVAINCAALTETLLESELFGHERGAFTGAIGRKQGKLEVADGGSVFLDEIGEMTLPMQSRLLRFLQKSGLQKLAGASGVVKLLGLANVEKLAPKFDEHFYFEEFGQAFPAIGVTRGRVAFLAGCIASVAFAELNRATVRVLQQNGVDVFIPREQGCCGALHAHAGFREQARELARNNIRVMLDGKFDAIVTNTAGCGSRSPGATAAVVGPRRRRRATRRRKKTPNT